MQQNQYDPLALSHQAAVVAATSLITHTLLNTLMMQAEVYLVCTDRKPQINSQFLL